MRQKHLCENYDHGWSLVVHCPDKGQRRQSHLPFCDKSSRLNLRPHWRFGETTEGSQQTQREPEEEPEEELPDPPEDDENKTADGQVLLPLQPPEAQPVPDLPAPLEMPTMETYKNR